MVRDRLLAGWMGGLAVGTYVAYLTFVWFAVGFEGILAGSFLDWLFFNRLLIVLLPCYAVLFFAKRERVLPLDITVFVVPELIWGILACTGHGSGANHIVVNPAMIGCVSAIYFVRYYVMPNSGRTMAGVIVTWVGIAAICVAIHLLLPVFHE
jgi:hypothetical protein